MTAESEPSSVTVIAADEHPLFLIGLAHTIRHDPGLRLQGVAQTGSSVLALIAEHRPQVAALGVHLDGIDGRDIVRTLRIDESATRVLLFSDVGTGELVLQCLTAGAAGFLTKRASPQDVRDAISAVGRGETVVPPEQIEAVAGALSGREDVTGHRDLTRRELQTLRLLADGESTATIAVRMDLSVATVKTHIQRLYAKLGVSDRGAAVAVGFRCGLISKA